MKSINMRNPSTIEFRYFALLDDMVDSAEATLKAMRAIKRRCLSELAAEGEASPQDVRLQDITKVFNYEYNEINKQLESLISLTYSVDSISDEMMGQLEEEWNNR